MKKLITVLFIFILTISLDACNKNKIKNSKPEVFLPSETTITNQAIVEQKNTGSKILVIYFTMPEDVNSKGVDAISGASIVVKNGNVLGNTQYIAEVITDTTGADLFEIKTVRQYPLEHQALIDQVASEKRQGFRPPLSTQINNLKDYDTIFLGYPNWWGDLPMPLYTFLEKNDLSGKVVIPFCPHGGSRFSGTIDTIAKLQPKAKVNRAGFTVSRDDVKNASNDIIKWLEDLSI